MYYMYCIYCLIFNIPLRTSHNVLLYVYHVYTVLIDMYMLYILPWKKYDGVLVQIPLLQSICKTWKLGHKFKHVFPSAHKQGLEKILIPRKSLKCEKSRSVLIAKSHQAGL